MNHTHQTTEVLRFKIFVLLIALGFFAFQEARATNTNNLTQTIRGTVLDEEIKLPLMGANIVLLSATEFTGTVTDMNGSFELKDVPVGRHEIQVSYMGYESRTLSNLLVNASKQLVLNIGL